MIELKELALPARPLVLLDLPATVDAPVGRAVEVPLRLTDPKLAADATFSLADGAPKGLAVAAGRLVWTPAEGDVGDRQVTVKAARGASSDAATVTFRVTRDSVDLGGLARSIDVDPAGDRAVAIVVPPGPQRDQFGLPGPVDVVLVDLRAMRVTARRRFDDAVAAVAVGRSAVYAAPANVARVHRLKLADLADDGRVFTNGNVTRFARGADGALVGVSGDEFGRAYDAKLVGPAPATLPSATTAPATRPAAGPTTGPRPPARRDTAPVLRDPVTGEIRFFNSYGGFDLLYSDSPQVPRWHPGPWERGIVDGQLMAPGDAVVSRLPQGPSELLEAYPAAATLVVGVEGTSPPTRFARVEFRGVVDGTQTEPLVLAQSPADRADGTDPRMLRFEAGAPRLFARDDRLVAVVGDRLFAARLPADRLAALPGPLRFLQRLDPVVVPVGGDVVVRPELVGGKGDRTFELPGGPEGTAIDAATGAVTIDTARAWRAFLARYDRAPQMGNPTTAPTPAATIDAARRAYRALTGRDAGDAYPVAVHLRLVARDAENQRAELSGAVLLLGPAKDVTEAIERQSARRAAA
ncbi:MAG TPA: putative Ig domain-containing protein, partial [Humisphaera sp.]